MKGDCPDAAEHSIPSYNGFHAGLNMEHRKSKACLPMSYSQPPNKSVVKDIMVDVPEKVSSYMLLESSHSRCSGAKLTFSFYQMAAILDVWVKMMS